MAALLTIFSMLVVTALLWALGPDWAIYSPASCTATRCFCELPRTASLIVQPANSLSSFAYVFAGLLMIILAQRDGWKSRFHPLAASYFGLTAVIVGLGSVLLHATLTLWGQFFDVAGMYLVSGFMVVSAVARWRRLSAETAIIGYLVLIGSLLLALYLLPDARRWLFAVVLLAAIILELGFARPRRPRVRVSYYLAGIAIKALAFTIWNLDQHGTLCEPDSPFQGHALWHIMGAASLWLTFCYYRSERRS